jgi:hypothetical protein
MPIVSTCAPAKVTLGVETLAKIGTGSDPFVQTIVAVDLNNDGASDLVGPDRSGIDVRQRQHRRFGRPASRQGDGTLLLPANTLVGSTSLYTLTAEDINGDGKLDFYRSGQTAAASS